MKDAEKEQINKDVINRERVIDTTKLINSLHHMVIKRGDICLSSLSTEEDFRALSTTLAQLNKAYRDLLLKRMNLGMIPRVVWDSAAGPKEPGSLRGTRVGDGSKWMEGGENGKEAETKKG